MSNIPLSTIQNLPSNAKKIFENVMKTSKGKTNPRTGKPYTDQERGKMAWAAVKKKYKKADGKWVKKSIDESYTFYTDSFEFKEVDGDFYAVGYISTPDLDLGNDIVTRDCLQDMLAQVQDIDITLKLGKEHEHILEDSRILSSAKIVSEVYKEDKIYRTGLDEIGLMAVTKLNKHHPGFDALKGSIEDGFVDAFSMEYKPIDFRYEYRDDKKIRLLNKVKLVGIAFTGRPMNTSCSIVDSFIKSLSIEEDEKNKLRGKSMTDKKEENVETTETEAETQEPEAPAAPETPETETTEPEKPEEVEETEEVKALKAKLAEYEAKEKDAKLVDKVEAEVKKKIKELLPKQKAVVTKEEGQKPFSFKNAWNNTHGVGE